MITTLITQGRQALTSLLHALATLGQAARPRSRRERMAARRRQLLALPRRDLVSLMRAYIPGAPVTFVTHRETIIAAILDAEFGGSSGEVK